MRVITQCNIPSRIVAFTGHRALPWGRNKNLALYLSAKNRIADAILAELVNGKNTFLCGLALGADTLFAEEVLRLRAEGRRMYLVAAIPSEQQTHAGVIQTESGMFISGSNATRSTFTMLAARWIFHAHVLVVMNGWWITLQRLLPSMTERIKAAQREPLLTHDARGVPSPSSIRAKDKQRASAYQRTPVYRMI